MYAAAAFAFLHLPLLVLGVFSFNSSRFTVWQGFSLRWYDSRVQDAQLAEAAWNSLLIALAATRRLDRCRNALRVCAVEAQSPLISGSLYTSLVTPEIVMGVSLLAFFQWVFRYLHVQLGMHTVILAHVMFSRRLRGHRRHGAAAHGGPRARRGGPRPRRDRMGRVPAGHSAA